MVKQTEELEIRVKVAQKTSRILKETFETTQTKVLLNKKDTNANSSNIKKEIA